MRSQLKKHPALAAGVGFGVVLLTLNIIDLICLSTGNSIPVAVPIVLVCLSLAYGPFWAAIAGR